MTTEEVVAILEGRKTQKRVAVKPTVKGCTVGVYYTDPEDASVIECVNVDEDGDAFTDIHCPFGKVGDRLWVREKWRIQPHRYDWLLKVYTDEELQYRADFSDEENACYGRRGGCAPRPWESASQMFKDASRITLEITNIKVDRLKCITNSGITKEGLKVEACNICPHSGGSGCDHCFAPIRAFESFWNSNNRKISYVSNPWVWVLSFKVVS